MPIIDENKLMLGAAINCNDKCFVYCPTINEIIGMGNDVYNKQVSYLTMTQSEVDSLLKDKSMNVTPYDFLFLQCSVDDTFLIELKDAFRTFIRERITVSTETKEIFIGTDKNYRVITEEDFNFLSSIIRKENDLSVPDPIPENESPIAKKFRLRREELARVKKKQANKDGETMTLAKSISAFVCFSNFTFKEIGILTYYQFHRLFEKFQSKYNFELDMQILCAGGDSSKINPNFWIKT